MRRILGAARQWLAWHRLCAGHWQGQDPVAGVPCEALAFGSIEAGVVAGPVAALGRRRYGWSAAGFRANGNARWRWLARYRCEEAVRRARRARGG